MARDLLYKPQPSLVVPDEGSDGKKRLGGTDKLGLPIRARDIGAEKTDKVDKSEPAPTPVPSTEPAPVAPPTVPRAPAFKAAYFNKDVESTAAVNQRTSHMQALRGTESALDLKKVSLPAGPVQSPDPAQLRSATDLMGLAGNQDLQSMLARQGGWARASDVTAEALEARMAMLQGMIEARVVALARMARLPDDRVGRSVTLRHARASQGAAVENAADVMDEGDSLARDTARQARGMHRRIAKALGIKLHEE